MRLFFGTKKKAIRCRNKVSILKAIKIMSRSNIIRACAVYKTISAKGARSPGYQDKTRPKTQIEYKELES